MKYAGIIATIASKAAAAAAVPQYVTEEWLESGSTLTATDTIPSAGDYVVILGSDDSVIGNTTLTVGAATVSLVAQFAGNSAGGHTKIYHVTGTSGGESVVVNTGATTRHVIYAIYTAPGFTATGALSAGNSFTDTATLALNSIPSGRLIVAATFTVSSGGTPPRFIPTPALTVNRTVSGQTNVLFLAHGILVATATTDLSILGPTVGARRSILAAALAPV